MYGNVNSVHNENTGTRYPTTIQHFKHDKKKIHPTQKPVAVLKQLISIFTDEGDTVIDPVAGSGTTLRAAYELNRHSYGFEVDRNFYAEAMDKMFDCKNQEVIETDYFIAERERIESYKSQIRVGD